MIEKEQAPLLSSSDTFLKAAFQGAARTSLILFGGLMLGLIAGDLVFKVLPGHSLQNPNPLHVAIASIPALIGFLIGGAVWGSAMGRLAGVSDSRRMGIAGLLGFGPVTILLAVGLSYVETIAGSGILARLPIHRLFTLLFVPAAFLIAGTSAAALGYGLKDRSLARSLFWRVGLLAAAAFLTVNLGMEAAGWVVGAPGAAQRLTMVTVLFLGNLGAAISGGALLGWLLDRSRRSGF